MTGAVVPLRATATVALLVIGVLLNADAAPASNKIYVHLYVDEEGQAADRVWKERLRKRLERSSKIIQRYASVRFIIGGYGTWQSDNATKDFQKCLRQFEQQVRLREEDLAVGFTSQYRFTRGRHHMGGIRRPLHSHILIRENNKRGGERQRTEILVHELCHFLGAAHSDRKDSAMRPVLGDGRTKSHDFQIQLDPINARIIQLVAHDMILFDVRRFADLSQTTKRRIRKQYAQLAEQLPDDTSAVRLLEMAR